MPRVRKTVCRICRRAVVCAWRRLDRPILRALPGYLRRPGDFSQALTAFTRAIRCHRRLARLAPSFFDSAVMAREAREREEQRRRMELWKPVFEKVYGPSPDGERWRDDPSSSRPPLPGPRSQRAVERELAGWRLWMDAGSLAMARQRQRRPQALPSFSQLSRLILIATDFGRLACGLETGQPTPPTPVHVPDVEESLARIYGHK